jgi:S-adenosylmethionine hydrolase
MITLSSDFRSPYPGAMKGVICQLTDARLIDVAHDLPRQDVASSGFWLRELLPYFPPAVHLAVIDPGVGTDRDALVVRAGEHALVGPDNGVLVPAAQRLVDDIEVFRIREGDGPAGDTLAWPPNPASSTFHGRDVFAPAAARVHELGVDGFEADEGFEPVEEYEGLTFPEPTIDEGGATGDVLAVDQFGNVITNVPGEHVTERFGERIEVGTLSTPVRESYAHADPGERLVTVGSHGNVELAVNQGRGDDAFGFTVGDQVRFSW